MSPFAGSLQAAVFRMDPAPSKQRYVSRILILLMPEVTQQMSEAIGGQLFLAVLIARLVSLYARGKKP
jgi:hypothetical protein